MRKVRRTTLITVGCFSLIAGVGMANFLKLPDSPALLLPLIGTLFIKNKNLTKVLLVVFVCLAAGLWRGGLFQQKLGMIRDLNGRQVIITATAQTDAVYGNNSQLDLTVSKAKLSFPYEGALAGQVKLSGFGVPMIYRGDTIRAEGKLYPARGSSQARLSYSQITIIRSDRNFINRFTHGMVAGMESSLPEPQASFGLGLLIGQRTNLPKDIVNQLTMVGLVHIVAVSGYNLTILVRATQRLRINSKYQKLAISLSLVTGFILITGFSASIVRAAIVSVLGLMAWYYGRDLRPVLLLAFTAALTGFANPFYIWSDLGWYLSFLAFFGVLVISPILAKKLFAKPPKLLVVVLLETFCAEIMTLPLIMAIFGQMSLIGLLANLIVVPIIPLAMLASAIAGFSGYLIPQIAGWVAWPAVVLLTYILDIVHLLSSLPSIFQRVSIDTKLMVFIYAVILVSLVALSKQLKEKSDIITDKNLINSEV